MYIFKKSSIILKYHFMVTTYPSLHRIPEMTITGKFHFPLITFAHHQLKTNTRKLSPKISLSIKNG